MNVIRSWINSHKKELRHYASYRIPNNTEVVLFPRLFWILAIQFLALYFGYTSKSVIPWWSMCILPFVATGFLVAIYSRERNCGLIGFFRYSSVFFALTCLSLIELTIAISIRETIQNALYYSFFAFLITVLCFLYSIRRQIERGIFSEENKQGPHAAPYIAAALGYVTHRICKYAISEKGESVFIVIVVGVLAGIVLGVSVVLWLKSVGATQE